MTAPTPAQTQRLHETIPDLLRRVREAPETDRDLDDDLFAAFRDVYVSGYYTRSVDAVLALIAERLPGWFYILETDPLSRKGETHHARLWKPSITPGISCVAPTPALALLAAALEAISGMERENV